MPQATQQPEETNGPESGAPDDERRDPLRRGSRFGNYLVGRQIAQGGMARIFHAEHAELQRPVALKILSPQIAKDPQGRERFLREARIAASIKHPNVVNIFDVGVRDGTPFIVMELLEGEDLETSLSRRGRLDETSVMDAVIPVAAGLAAVHEAGVVHRDLKPGNVFLTRRPHGELEPKLLDFGISRSVRAEDFRLTASDGLLMGTPEYLCPEYIRGADVTPLSDQYALGVLIYECVTGENPFIADSVAETMRNVARGRVTPASEKCPGLSPRLARIIERAMSVEPIDRFEDVRAMGRELLFLAGKRTRVTWGLMFEDDDRADPLANPGTSRSKAAGRASAAALQRWAWGAAAVLGLALLVWITGARIAPSDAGPSHIDPAATSPGSVAAAASAPSRTAVHALRERPGVETEPTPPRAPGTVPAAASPAATPTSEAAAPEEASAPEAESTPPSKSLAEVLPAVTEEDASSGSDTQQRARAPTSDEKPEREAQPPAAARPPRRGAFERTSDPDWLLPSRPQPVSTQPPIPPSRPSVGTNNAPILD